MQFFTIQCNIRNNPLGQLERVYSVTFVSLSVQNTEKISGFLWKRCSEMCTAERRRIVAETLKGLASNDSEVRGSFKH